MKLMVYSSGIRLSWNGPRKIVVVRAFIMIIFMYSAIKNRANGPAAYSTLNPDTNSDSPSARSKGARLVSAKVEINHIMARGHVGIINHMYSCATISVDRVNDPLINKTHKRMIAKVTS